MDGNEFKQMLAEIRKLEGEKADLLDALKMAAAMAANFAGDLERGKAISSASCAANLRACAKSYMAAIAKAEGRAE